MKTVGFLTGPNPTDDLRLLHYLGWIFQVDFQPRSFSQLESMDAFIASGHSQTNKLSLARLGIPGLIISDSAGEPGTNAPAVVQFSTSEWVPKIFRGRTLEQIELGSPHPIAPENGESILATIQGQPVWTARQDGSFRTDVVGLSLPPFDPQRSFFHYFEGFNFFRLLPVIEFLRRLTGEDTWSAPGLRSCFMFDDPNLHGLRYGWLDYEEVARQAVRHNYHVSLATIPLDTWFTSNRSAAIFRKHHDRLSLLIHGNEHSHAELTSFATEADALASVGQALNRIEELERVFSIEIPKVMAAPHGAFSEECLRAMSRVGYEAGTTGYGALHPSNHGKEWANCLGVAVCETIEGTPIVPRFRFKWGERFILLAAYLNQPIIPYGHHQDVADGLDVLKNLADIINSLGDVQWLDMKGIARSNFLTRQKERQLHIRSYARTFQLKIPTGVEQIRLERILNRPETEGIRIRAQGRQEKIYLSYVGESIPVVPGETIEISFIHPQAVSPKSVGKTTLHPLKFARRQFCEIRDRLAPKLQKRSGKPAAP